MKKIGSIAVIVLWYGASLLPFFVLYGIADLFYFFAYKCFGYRTKVVRSNLRRSFPEKNNTDLSEIEKKFYRQLFRTFADSIKITTASPATIRNKVNFQELNQVKVDYESGRNIVAVMGHMGSWEMVGLAIPFLKLHQGIYAYHQVKDKNINGLMKASREKTGAILYPMKQLRAQLRVYDGIPFGVGLLADQAAPALKCYWMEFLNQPTTVFFGAEKIALEHDCAVYFLEVTSDKAGRYNVVFKKLFDRTEDLGHGAITEAHVKALEENIKKQPELWLWSHKRWKKTLTNDVDPLMISKKFPPVKEKSRVVSSAS